MQSAGTGPLSWCMSSNVARDLSSLITFPVRKKQWGNISSDRCIANR